MPAYVLCSQAYMDLDLDAYETLQGSFLFTMEFTQGGKENTPTAPSYANSILMDRFLNGKRHRTQNCVICVKKKPCKPM